MSEAGQVIEILITDKEAGDLGVHNSAELHEGKGIVGDRYYDTNPDDAVTLIDWDVIDAVNKATGWSLTPADTRRNIVTRGVDLNQWETSRFKIGDAVLEGFELCEPCAILGGLLANDDRSSAEVVKALTHKAGLRARILQGATISAGDAVSGD